MWRVERHKLIRQKLGVSGRVSISDLVRDTGVTRETLRADLEEMAAAGDILRVRGGAVIAPAPDDPEASFQTRIQDHPAEKLAIGREAARLLPRGASLLIDAGSTTAAFARSLSARPDLRILTNSLHVARRLAASHDTLLLGGVPDKAGQGVYGELTLAQLRRFRVDVAVISPVAIDAAAGLTNFDLREAELASAMFEAAERRMALAHAAKLGHRSRVSIAPLEALDWLVTDRLPPAPWPPMPRLVIAPRDA
ncbi:DeoR/GlpR family DNA-binding transcription regulator [Falsirhodobacter deserti]|uniref:DeoR/GlpR family DNA-binding transcription regulator n=1 Tax=Falsirhodobacter deserti TaxID=1365611 RepID=UPI000FE2E167|nr:DeoR/GlpR family DNA-binding transcription regulator [Falsirhodobacter deserti]